MDAIDDSIAIESSRNSIRQTRSTSIAGKFVFICFIFKSKSLVVIRKE